MSEVMNVGVMNVGQSMREGVMTTVIEKQKDGWRLNTAFHLGNHETQPAGHNQQIVIFNK